MKCHGCQEENGEDPKNCSWCGGRLYDYPWNVWWRYRSGDNASAWHNVPKIYRTERAARMVERDLNAAYTFAENRRVQYLTLPRGVSPTDLYL